MEITDKGICLRGFKAYGVRKDGYGVAVILSETLANASVMVTSNRVLAAPLKVTLQHVSKGVLQGVVANSGCANAYTGEKGIEDAREMCRTAAARLGVQAESLAVASTGVIGRPLDMPLVKHLINKAAISLESGPEASLAAAKAIMTTDTKPKIISVKTRLETGEEVEIGGIAKGAGMIAPKLRLPLSHATMLAFITTDAYIPRDRIDSILKEAVEQSFNRTVIDGDTSTNDLVVFLGNGVAGNKDVDGEFQEALNFVTKALAKMLVKDAEGATKLLVVRVKGARRREDAVLAAKAIAGSNLVKTAVFGGDPNWGRIIAATGYSGAEFKPENLSLHISDKYTQTCLIEKGRVLALPGSEALINAGKVMKAEEIVMTLDLGEGGEEATAYGCDMGYDYIKINSEYTS
jgi:glutamate N-acetyltransferase/amino-acid N-acetyltransferase